MALVSYDYSDSSDYEDNEGDKDENIGKDNGLTLLEAKEEVKIKINDVESQNKTKEALPPPVEIKSNFNVVSWAVLTKNRTQPIRISVPSLQDEDNEEPKPKLKPSSKKSGLFALLPKPKQQLLVPPSLNLRKQEKKKEALKQPNPFLKGSTKGACQKPTETANKPTSSSDNTLDDGENEEEPQSFFFLPEKEIEENHKIEIANFVDDNDVKVCASFEDNTQSNEKETDSSPHSSIDYTYPALPESSSDVELDKEALEKLCGRRGKRLAGEIEMVDVSGAELVGDSKLWLAKELTTQRVHFKRSKFDPLQRRKHQITFLAAQAREQELELANQWASNRMTRKQTQAKYGF